MAIALVLVAALGWLGWRLLGQDRALERQRTRDRLENAADVIGAELFRAVGNLGDSVAAIATLPAGAADAAAMRLAAPLPADAAVLLGTTARVDAYPRNRLLYYPLPFAATDAPARIFARGDSLEFRARDPASATRVYRALTASPDASVRAAALMRVGRTTRKTHDIRQAAAAYDEMSRLDVPVNGVPAALIARAAKLSMWRDLDDSAGMRREGMALHDELHAGRWRLPQAAFAFYDGEVSRALEMPAAPHGNAEMATRMALADAAATAWLSWRSDEAPQSPASGGVRVVEIDGRSFVIIWSSGAERIVALVGGDGFIAHAVLAGVTSLLDRRQVRLTLAGENNRPIMASGGPEQAGTPRVSRAAAETRLPWTLHVTSAATSGDVGTERERLLLAGFVVAVGLALLGIYAVSRAANRELGAAKLQSDFVAAVSHEFRTPLTSLRQLTELLASGRVSSATRQAEYYEAMRRETVRLHRFVEALLDFGRADAGLGEKRTDAVEVGRLVRETVAEFARETSAAGFSIDVAAPPGPCMVLGDSEALERALWNLLDNALKYSADARVIHVDVQSAAPDVFIRVRDQGIGIPRAEQSAIFEKFQRGATARDLGIRGTGIGLAIVRQVADAHGGSVSVESAPGAGSAFTISLPLAGPP